MALTEPGTGGPRLAAVDAAGAAADLHPGMLLTDARALCPGLTAQEHDPAADAKALAALAQWALRYTPLPATDPPDGLFLDISGCAHLFEGEAGMLAKIVTGLAALGYEARAGLADTAGAAWAAARLGKARTIVPAGKTAAWLADKPLSALRLEPRTVEKLARLGIKSAGRLAALPRAALAARFGAGTLDQLDKALGRAEEPLNFAAPAPRYGARRLFAEPLGHLDGIAATARDLAESLSGQLKRAGAGARRFSLTCHRTDNHRAMLEVRAARPCRDAEHIARLVDERLQAWEPEFDPGFGFEALVLAAWGVERLEDGQLTGLAQTEEGVGADPEALARLIDRLANRVAKVTRPQAKASHIPERGAALAPVLETPDTGTAMAARAREGMTRPPMLLARPEPLQVTAEVPDGPPLALIWRRVTHRVRRAEGPERIAPEWWHAAPGAEPPTRDYYRVEDAAGQRFWVFREGLYEGAAPAPRWYMHGLFP